MIANAGRLFFLAINITDSANIKTKFGKVATTGFPARQKHYIIIGQLALKAIKTTPSFGKLEEKALEHRLIKCWLLCST